MKKLLVSILVAAMVGATLTGCGSKGEGNGNSSEQTSSASAADIVNTLQEKYIRMPMPVDEATAKDMYHINLDDVENYGIAKTGISPGNDLIMVVKAKEGKVDAVKAAADKVKEDLVGNAWYPDEKDAAEKATVEVNGNFVSIIMVNDEVAADAKKDYEELIKK